MKVYRVRTIAGTGTGIKFGMVLEIKPMAEGIETEVLRPAFTTMADRFSMTHP